MGGTPNIILLAIKSKFNREVINGRIIIISVIYNKPANSISKAKFKYNAANSVGVVKATMLAELL
jgi:hypothetical protein